jgi:hypothetical protein
MKNYCFILLLFTLSFYAQNDTISIIKHTDKDIVVNKESKIVYRGMPNDLYINVPNCKSFTVTAEGLKKITNTNYILSPKAGNEVIISIDIVLKNGKKITEKHLFAIKNISSFVTSINGRNGLVRMQKTQLKDAIIKVSFEDKNLSFSNKITGFILRIPNMPAIEVIGNKIDKYTYEKILKNTSHGDVITISDIKFIVLEESMKGGMCFKRNPIVVEIY